MKLYKTILSFVITLPFSLLVASSDQENTLQESGLNTASHKMDNRPIAPKPVHPILTAASYRDALKKVDIYKITESYQSIYEKAEHHPQKDMLRAVSFHFFTERAVQEVTWINEKLMEFQILGEIAHSLSSQGKVTSYFARFFSLSAQKAYFNPWVNLHIMGRKDPVLHRDLSNLRMTYGQDLDIAEIMMDDYLMKRGNPYAIPDISDVINQVSRIDLTVDPS